MKFQSPVYSAVSGSVAGLTYSRNRGGNYVRARQTPTNPATPAQQLVRTVFAGLVSEWGSLTVAERQAWTDYGANTPTTDSLGQTLVLTGQQEYLASNTPRLRASLSRIDAAPVIYDRGVPVIGLTAERNVAETDLTVVATFAAPLPAAATLLMQDGPLQNAGVNFFAGPFQFIQGDSVLATFSTHTMTIPAASFPAGLPPAGSNLPLRARLTYDDARLSTPYRELVVVGQAT